MTEFREPEEGMQFQNGTSNRYHYYPKDRVIEVFMWVKKIAEFKITKLK